MTGTKRTNDEALALGNESRGGRTTKRDFETAIDRIDRMNRTVFQQIIERRFVERDSQQPNPAGSQ